MAYVIIHQLNEAQVQQLHALYRRQWWSQGRKLNDVRRLLEHCDVIVGVADSESGTLRAFARATTDRVYKAMIFDVIVAEESRGRGLGRMVMDAVLSHPVLQGVEHIELYCRPDVTAFYEGLGFSTNLPGVHLMRRTR